MGDCESKSDKCECNLDKFECTMDECEKIWACQLRKAKLVIRINTEYIVSIEDTGEIYWQTKPEYEREMEGGPGYNSEEENSTLKEVASLVSVSMSGLDSEVQLSFKRQIAEAIAFNIVQDYTSAKQMLISANDFIKARSQEKSREWYLSATFLASVPFFISGSCLWEFRKWSLNEFGNEAFWLLLATSIGAIGALFSVIVRSGKIKYDHSAGQCLHNLEGFSRVVAGAIAGFLIALAIRSGIVFSVLSSDGRMHELMIFGALIGGAAERLATSIISKFEAPHISSSVEAVI